MEELSGPSSAGGKVKLRLQHRPSLLQALPDIAQSRIKALSQLGDKPKRCLYEKGSMHIPAAAFYPVLS